MLWIKRFWITKINFKKIISADSPLWLHSESKCSVKSLGSLLKAKLKPSEIIHRRFEYLDGLIFS